MSAAYKIRSLPRILLMTLGALLIGGAAYVDHATGRNLSFLCFYLIPVSFFIWFTTRRIGALSSVLCATVWFVENVSDKAYLFNSEISYLNMSIELVFFFLATLLLSSLKEALGINEELSRMDALTGAVNRRAFYDLAGREIARLERYKHPFTVAYMDIDNFKIVNYRFGHKAGDQLLRSVADTVRKNLRKLDIISRFGGDEFTMLLPETGAEAAQAVLSRMRNVLLNIMETNKWPVTFTFGTVTFLKPPSSVEEMVKKVGSLMYAGKDSGMNTIEQEIFDA
ncbi:MAG: GGDEF domain-containing protein [Candidatus Omnitrophica bacterium]|nr:GGDEF domain-containing protein [Candidatus Omnitrophota bacterium]